MSALKCQTVTQGSEHQEPGEKYFPKKAWGVPRRRKRKGSNQKFDQEALANDDSPEDSNSGKSEYGSPK